MRTAHLCLPILALTASLAAQEIDAPEPRWPVAYTFAAAMADDAGAAEQAGPEQPQAAQDPAKGHSAPATQPDSASAPVTEAVIAGSPPAEKHHSHFVACAPNLAVVEPDGDVTPLSPHQKFRIFYTQLYNPCRYASAALVAGISQAHNGLSGYGQGAEGYGKRVGANLADNALASFFGRALLPTLLHDDPRYFRMGPSASFTPRMTHAIITPVWTRRDNGDHRINYSRVLGGLITASIANAYYPETDRGAGDTFKHFGFMVGFSSASAAFQEFWPDIKTKFKKHK